MKSDARILDKLNDLLAEELTAINQYMVQAEMAANWGYGKLHVVIEKRAMDEMHHAEKLIARILFLEGIPIVSRLDAINIGSNVEQQHANDRVAEVVAVQMYNDGIKITTDLGDNGTKEMLESILPEEEAHLDWIETQIGQIAQIGLQNYLAQQM